MCPPLLSGILTQPPPTHPHKTEINLFPSSTLSGGGDIPQQGFSIPGVICSNTLEPLSTNFVNEEFSLKSRDGWRRRKWWRKRNLTFYIFTPGYCCCPRWCFLEQGVVGNHSDLCSLCSERIIETFFWITGQCWQSPLSCIGLEKIVTWPAFSPLSCFARMCLCCQSMTQYDIVEFYLPFAARDPYLWRGIQSMAEVPGHSNHMSPSSQNNRNFQHIRDLIIISSPWQETQITRVTQTITEWVVNVSGKVKCW